MKEDKIIASIIIATYNGSKFIKEQLESIYKSIEYTNSLYEFEVVILDDYSTDNTCSILNSLRDIYHFKLFFNNRNLGHNGSFEKAINLSKGEILILSDQDDIWPVDRLQLMLSCLEKRKAAGIIGSFTAFRDSLIIKNKNIINVNTNYQESIFDVFINQIISAKTKPYYGCCMAFKRNVLKIAMPFPKVVTEHDKWLALCISSTNNGLIRLPTPVTYRRLHENNITKTDRIFIYKLLTRLEIVIYILTIFLRKIINFFILKTRATV